MSHVSADQGQGQMFIRPHDVEVYASPRDSSVPAR